MLRTAFASAAVLASVITATVSPLRSARAAAIDVPQGVLQQVAATSRARIIVGLTGGSPPAGVAQLGDRVEQRAQIAAAQERVLATVAGHSVTAVKRFRFTPAVAMEVDAAALRTLAGSPDVAYIEEDRVDSPFIAETRIITGAITAAEHNYKGAGATIAILDTGIDYRDPYFGGGGTSDDASPNSRVVSEACYSTTSDQSVSACLNGTIGRGAARPYPFRPGFEHGTDIAGIVAGENPGTRTSPEGHGMAPAATIVAVQIFSVATHAGCKTYGQACAISFVSDEILGLERVYDLRTTFNIVAVNLSVGSNFPFYSTQAECDAANRSRQEIIATLRSVGIATVVGSGYNSNDFINVMSAPACVSGAISVGTTMDGSWHTANPIDGILRDSNSAPFLELLAPGLTVTVRGREVRGTSVAAAHVTGAWALVKSRFPALSVQEVLDIFKASGKPIVDPRNGVSTPRINVAAALGLPVPACAYRVSHTETLARQDGDTIDVAVETQEGCPWSAWGGYPTRWFATIAPIFGVGSRMVSISVTANNTDQRRTGAFYVNGELFVFHQARAQPWPRPFDANRDDHMDLLWQHQTGGHLAAWMMDGAMQVAGTSLWPSQVEDTDWKVVGAGDLDGDGSDDLVWQHIGDGRVSAWFMNGLTLRSGDLLSVPQVADLQWRIGAVADLDKDGRADLLWRHQGDGRLALWLMEGATVLSAFELRDGWSGALAEPDPNWRLVGMADFSFTGGTPGGNGSGDIVWHNQTTGEIRVWWMSASRLVEVMPTVPSSVPDVGWQIRALGDMNRDGHPDLIWQHTLDGRVAVWFMNGVTLVEGRLLSPSQVPDTNWHIVGPR